MKKQLVILSFLVGSFSLWGMDRGYKAVMDLERQPIIQHALADTPEKKEALSLKLFKQFHQKVFEYFKEDQIQEKRFAVLTWIRDWLPLFAVLKSQEELNYIQGSLDNYKEIVDDSDQAAEFFADIYRIYLRRHPMQLCKVLSVYFRWTLIQNKCYRILSLQMLDLLGKLSDEYLPAPSVENAPNISKWSDVINLTSQYIKGYTPSLINLALFSNQLQSIKDICAQLSNALQKRKQTEAPKITVPSSTDGEPQEPAGIEEQTEEPLGLPAVTSQLKKDTDTEVKDQQVAISQSTTTPIVGPGANENTETTFWQKFIAGIKWLSDALWIIGNP